MKSFLLIATYLLSAICPFCSAYTVEKAFPDKMQKIMDQSKYDHSIWGIYVKDLKTGDILYDLNSDKLFSPGSTSKLFSVAALLHAFGDDYRFKTPVYYSGKIDAGKLQGDLILVAQGDLTFGGRETKQMTIDYTKMDHIYANMIPGAILTTEDPLSGLDDLAKQIYTKGIKEINGDVVIDDTLFESTEKRGMILSPIIINDNLIDIVINPTEIGQKANLTWRPQVPGYTVKNQVKTVSQGKPLAINITSDESKKNIVIEGTIPTDQKNIVRTFTIMDPKSFARTAFIQALEQNGVKVNLSVGKEAKNQSLKSFKNSQQIALKVSPPLSEYAKLILKVSHNLGADLVALLLASQQGKKTFDEGMLLLGDFITQEVKIKPDSFVFIDAAGGNENRLTPQAEIQMLEYMHKLPSSQFTRYYEGLPILGVDGSLEDFAKNTKAVGKVRAKPGTGVSFNLAIEKFFLITQGFAGYIEGQNGQLYAYIVIVNNASMPTMEDVFGFFQDDAQISNILYDQSNTK